MMSCLRRMVSEMVELMGHSSASAELVAMTFCALLLLLCMLFFKMVMSAPDVDWRVLMSPAQSEVVLNQQGNVLAWCTRKMDTRRWLWTKMKLIVLCSFDAAKTVFELLKIKLCGADKMFAEITSCMLRIRSNKAKPKKFSHRLTMLMMLLVGQRRC